jgi:hypothetical protein
MSPRAAKAHRPISFLQCEFLAQLRSYFVGEFLGVLVVLRRSHHRRSPAEQRIPAYRYEHTADQQPLKNHIFELGVGFCFLDHWILFYRLPHPKVQI